MCLLGTCCGYRLLMKPLRLLDFRGIFVTSCICHVSNCCCSISLRKCRFVAPSHISAWPQLPRPLCLSLVSMDLAAPLLHTRSLSNSTSNSGSGKNLPPVPPRIWSPSHSRLVSNANILSPLQQALAHSPEHPLY